MVENLKIEGIKDYPIKWICNFRGQKAIGICGYSQKIAMFAADSRVSKILEDIVIGTKEELEGYGCEEKDRCCNFECEFCEINPRQYLQITGKKTVRSPSRKKSRKQNGDPQRGYKCIWQAWFSGAARRYFFCRFHVLCNITLKMDAIRCWV